MPNLLRKLNHLNFRIIAMLLSPNNKEVITLSIANDHQTDKMQPDVL